MSAGRPASADWPRLFTRRLLRRLEGLEGPLVRLWGWPGSGLRLLLRELEAHGGRQIAPALLTAGAALAGEASKARADGGRWLLCREPRRCARGALGEDMLAAVEHLPLGLPLLLIGRGRPSVPAGSSDFLPPHELLLTAPEIVALWSSVAGETLDLATAEAWRRVTDGWYLPLRLAAEAAAAKLFASRPASAERLLELPSVRFFLRSSVLDSFSSSLREALLSQARTACAQQSALSLRALEESHQEELADGGWSIEEAPPSMPRLPALLEAWLVAASEEGSSGAPAEPSSRTSPRSSPRSSPRVAYRISLFGDPQAFRLSTEDRAAGDRAREQEVVWPLARSLRLLAYLASAPDRRASKEELTDALFAERDPVLIRRNFHPTLSHLRRCLGGGRDSLLEPVLYQGGGYRLNPAYEWQIDLSRFETLLASSAEHRRTLDLEPAARDLHAAWKLYRGPFLHGLYDSWVARRRDALHRVYLKLLRDLGEIYRELGNLEEALDAYRGVLVEDPLDEAVQAEVMHIYAASGRRDLVRRQYDRLSILLSDELGVEPLPETTAAYHRLMA